MGEFPLPVMKSGWSGLSACFCQANGSKEEGQSVLRGSRALDLRISNSKNQSLL